MLSRIDLERDYGILLSSGAYPYLILVDRRDRNWARQHKWRVMTSSAGIRSVRAGNRGSLLHTMVLTKHVGPPPPDHVAAFRNGDRLDCQLANLYWCHKDETPFKIAKAARAAATGRVGPLIIPDPL